MSFLLELFGTEKPIIGLVHIQPLPGDPFYRGEGMDAVIQRAKADLQALQDGGCLYPVSFYRCLGRGFWHGGPGYCGDAAFEKCVST